MGSLTFYNRDRAIERMNRLGKEGAAFFFLIDFDMSHCLVERVEDLPATELLFAFPGQTNAGIKMTEYPNRLKWEAQPQSFETYSRSFNIVYRNLHEGNSFLTNLTCATPVDTDLSLLQLFEHAEAKYKLWI